MKIGIAGAGMIVNEFFKFAHEVNGIEITAICATSQEEIRLQELCRIHRIPKYYTDFNIMLADDNVEVIYVAVPNHMHYCFSKKALEAKKHVICEKPFTSNIKEAEELIQISKENHVIILEAVTTRYIPNTLKMKEMLPQLGEIKIVTANYSQYSSRYDAFKKGEMLPAFNPDMSGGALMDLNIYNINLMVILFGTPKNVSYQANIEKGIDTSGILILDYGSFKSVCIAAKDCKAPVSATIQGDKGCINISSSVNIMADFELYLNNDSSIRQLNRESGKIYDYNMGQHRMYHEFKEFVRIIDKKDYEGAEEMLQISLATMDIQTKARQTAGIVFAADKC
nr:Gfo/Idh/MocA family oxidoreductase [uncultured Clostridium sp.]